MPSRSVSLAKASQSRVFIIEDTAGPGRSAEYMALARASAVTWPQGDATPVRVPSQSQYGAFDVVDRIRGQQGLPQMTLEFRKTREMSAILNLIRGGCPIDIQLHIGACKNPTDFNEGWDLIMVLEDALPTSYDVSDIGALDADQDNPSQEAVPFTGLDYYEIGPIVGAEVAAAEIVQEIVDVVICDSKSCGECGLPSNGCQVIFALALSVGTSPGLAGEIIYTKDGGLTWADTNVSSLAVDEDPNRLACVGSNLVVISEDSESLHYASIVDILNGVETWAEITNGFVATKGPTAIFSLGRTMTWIAAEGGYIYFGDDVTSVVVPQTSGDVTTQDLNAIHGANELNLLAVGASNAVLVTHNGGETWASVTGPAVGVALTAAWMLSENEWLIGTEDGRLFGTRDGGTTWSAIAFPGSGAGVIRDLSFSGSTVGYMSHDTATPRGRVLRTIDGGNSWYVLPEGAVAALPLSDRFNAIAACEEDKNLVFAGGLADNAADGILVKIA